MDTNDELALGLGISPPWKLVGQRLDTDKRPITNASSACLRWLMSTPGAVWLSWSSAALELVRGICSESACPIHDSGTAVNSTAVKSEL